VPRLVPCNILIYAANFIIIFDGLENHSVLGYVEYLTAFTYPFVFLNYCGNIELHLGKTIFFDGRYDIHSWSSKYVRMLSSERLYSRIY